MLPLRKASRALIKDINRNLVLNLIQSQAPISRVELARRTGLSPATITGIVSDYINSGLVHSMGQGESTGGRRPVLLRLNHKAGFVVGAKLMERAVATAVTDLDANVLFHQVTLLTIADKKGKGSVEPGPFLRGLVDAIEAAIASSGVDRERLLGIGVGMAGVVDAQAGLSRYSPFFGWQGVQIAEPLADHFKLAVYVENDVNTLTIAEQWFGHGHGVDNFIVVTVGRGVGAGIVVNGQFYRGAIGGAGEVGHMALKPDGPRCDCGQLGCLEALASDDAILRRCREAIAAGQPTSLSQISAQTLTVEAVVQAADQGDPLARQLLAEAGRWLGIGIANLVDVLNPQLVIVAGEGVRAGAWRIDPMREAILEHSFNGLVDDLEITIGPSGDEGWARGAACVVLGKLFASPLNEPVSGLLA
jgi:predicted NBD/HSP70 family sugar kinase